MKSSRPLLPTHLFLIFSILVPRVFAGSDSKCHLLLATVSSPRQFPPSLLPVPLASQETDYSCGPASLLSVLKYWELYNGAEQELRTLLSTSNENGTRPEEIVRVARQLKLEAALKENATIEMLRDAVKKREPVILALQGWRDDPNVPWKEIHENGHYLVVVGIDELHLHVMDPSIKERYGSIPLKELYGRWHDHNITDGQIRHYNQLAIFLKGGKSE